MSKAGTSSKSPETQAATALPEAAPPGDAPTDPSVPPALPSPDAEAVAPPVDVDRPVLHYWKPTLDASIEIGWAQFDGERFMAQVMFSSAGMLLYRARSGADAGSQLLVETIIDRNNREVPFSVRTSESPTPFLSGSFEYRVVDDVVQFWLLRLRYPGGMSPDHRFV